MSSITSQGNPIDKGESIHSSSDKYVKEISNLLDGKAYVKVSGGFSSEMSSSTAAIKTEHDKNYVMNFYKIFIIV